MAATPLERVEALLDRLYRVRTEQTAAALGWLVEDAARVVDRIVEEADLADQLRALGVQ